MDVKLTLTDEMPSEHTMDCIKCNPGLFARMKISHASTSEDTFQEMAGTFRVYFCFELTGFFFVVVVFVCLICFVGLLFLLF